MSVSVRTSLLAAALVIAPALAHSQTLLGRSDSIYTWRGELRDRALFTVRNHNGPIDVRPSSGSTLEFRAEKRPGRNGGSLNDVAFDVATSSNGDVTICSTFRNHNPCDDRNDRNNQDDWRRNVTVAITILLPRGAELKVATGNGAVTIENTGGNVQASTGNGRVRLSGNSGEVRISTGNGDVDVRGATAPVRVTTGNGRVEVSTSTGPVEARTGNGDIDVTMTALRAREDMTFSSGSGSIRVTLPAGYNGELDATTGNGELRSEFDLKIQGRVNPRHIRATIGEGGPRLRLSTGNGRLEVRKGTDSR